MALLAQVTGDAILGKVIIRYPELIFKVVSNLCVCVCVFLSVRLSICLVYTLIGLVI